CGLIIFLIGEMRIIHRDQYIFMTAQKIVHGVRIVNLRNVTASSLITLEKESTDSQDYHSRQQKADPKNLPEPRSFGTFLKCFIQIVPLVTLSLSPFSTGIFRCFFNINDTF